MSPFILASLLSKHFGTISGLLNDVRSDGIGGGGAVKEETIYETVLPNVFSSISKLNATEFDELIEDLLTFVLVDWEQERCFVSLRVVGKIFGYISSIASKPLVNEFLVLFSAPDAPPQLKYYLLPDIAENLKHSVKNVILDNTLCDLIYFMKMKHLNLSTPTVSAVETKFIRPFWTRLQYKWSDRTAETLLPVFVQMVDIIPYVSQETILEVKKAIMLQILEQKKVPLYSLLCASVILLGLTNFEYEVNGNNWKEVCEICCHIFQRIYESDSTHTGFPFAIELQCFVVKTLCTFLRNVDLESEDMLNKIIAVTSSELTKNTISLVQSSNSNGKESHDTESNFRLLISNLEDLVEELKEQKFPSDVVEMARFRKAVAELSELCQ